MTTTTYPVAPHPGYEVPITLRQALSAGVDITVMDADSVGMMAYSASEHRRREWAVLARHTVTAALRAETTYLVPHGNRDGGYTLQWPSQDSLNADQWLADLIDETDELLPAVLERLTPAQRDTVRWHISEVERLAALERHQGTTL